MEVNNKSKMKFLPGYVPAPALAFIFLTLLFWGGYWHITNNDWRIDDPDHLTTVRSLGLSRLYQLFIEPEIWGQVSTVNFCPINVAMYGVWLNFFGPYPKLAYIQHLLTLFLLVIAYYTYLLRYVRPALALGFTLLCFGSLPAYGVAIELMSNHYVLGALFAVLALHAFDEAPKHGMGFWLTGALLSALAALCKEIFGFVAIYPFLRELMSKPIISRDFAGLRQRMVPPVVALVPTLGFAIWRHIMLNNQIGGYGLFTKPEYEKGLTYVFGDHFLLPSAGLVLVALLLGMSRGWTMSLSALLVVLYSFIPSFFVVSVDVARYWFLPILSICFFLTLAWPTNFKKAWLSISLILSILMVTAPLLVQSLSKIPSLKKSTLEESRASRERIDLFKKRTAYIELTDQLDALKKMSRAKKTCLAEEDIAQSISCHGEFVLFGTKLEDIRDTIDINKITSKDFLSTWSVIEYSHFDINVSYVNGVLSWTSGPCPTNRMTLIYKPDGYNNQLYNGVDPRKDWLVSNVPCHTSSGVKAGSFNWIDMLAIVDDGRGGKYFTPLFRADLTKGIFKQSIEAIHLGKH